MVGNVISVRLTNRRAQFLCTPEEQASLKSLFSYAVPGARFSERYRMGIWDGNKSMMSRGCVASGLFLDMRAELKVQGWRFKVQDKCLRPKFFSVPRAQGKGKESRPYQQEAIAKMMAASGNGGIVLSATGSGKTHLVGGFFEMLDGAGLFIVDELTLLEQARRELSGVLGEQVGVVGHSEFKPRRITVATIQTLHRHRTKAAFLKWFATVEVVVIDELHTAVNRSNIGVVSIVRPKAVFGLTATLELQKPHVRMPAVALTGPVIFQYPMQQGVAEGYLSRGVAISVQFHDPLLKRQADYQYHIPLNKVRNDCVEALIREGIQRGRRVIALVIRLAHLHILERRAIGAGIPCRVLCGAKPQEERLEAMRAMDAGEVQLLLATRVFAKGVDIRSVDTIIDATGLPSRNNVQQRYGRGVRKAAGKKGLLYFDVCDTHNQFAFAGRMRAKALEELGVTVLRKPWEGGAKAIYDGAERQLKKELESIPV